LQEERIAAFGEYIDDVKTGRFPEAGNVVEMDEEVLADVMARVGALV
jgi:3-methyl-2-oxobutanoate hydroxymethyltransferase